MTKHTPSHGRALCANRPAPPPQGGYREVTIPAGQALTISLASAEGEEIARLRFDRTAGGAPRGTVRTAGRALLISSVFGNV